MSSFSSGIPVLDNLENLARWLLLIVVLLAGAVILLAYRAAVWKDRARDLERRLGDDDTPVTLEHPTPLSDDRPIPLATANRKPPPPLPPKPMSETAKS